VSGIPVVGQTLTGSAGTWSAPGVVLELQWLRDGSPIAGATGPTYRLVAADAGRAIALDVTATRDGYADGRATSAPVTASQPVSTRLRLSVAKSLKAGAKAKLTVRVSGAYDPTGKVEVTLRAAGEKAITVSGRLSNGSVRVTSPKLDAGTYKVVASYDGDDLHRGDSDTAKIKVKARKGR
jgi:alpha-L-rhamnosidase